MTQHKDGNAPDLGHVGRALRAFARGERLEQKECLYTPCDHNFIEPVASTDLVGTLDRIYSCKICGTLKVVYDGMTVYHPAANDSLRCGDKQEGRLICNSCGRVHVENTDRGF